MGKVRRPMARRVSRESRKSTADERRECNANTAGGIKLCPIQNSILTCIKSIKLQVVSKYPISCTRPYRFVNVKLFYVCGSIHCKNIAPANKKYLIFEAQRVIRKLFKFIH